MVCEMESDCIEDMMDIEELSSMWPEDVGTDVGKQFNIEKPGRDQDMLEEVTILEEPAIADFQRLMELTNYTDKGSSQLAYLMQHWEYKQANAVRLLREELDNLSKQRKEVEQRKLEILKENNRFEEEISYGGDKRPVSILDDAYYTWQDLPAAIRKSDIVVQNKRIEIEAEYDTVVYWKQRSQDFEKQLEASIRREDILKEKLQESIETIERQSSPVEELSQILKRADNFLHFILQNAPVVIGHQDKELRYRFIYNHFPSLQEEDIIGKTDVEIFTGAGVKESQDFKREVMEKGVPAKKEITFETELFGFKTFLIYVEPVFSKAGETIGVNYMGMEITDQVRKRERMAKLREEIAVQKAKETELNKTIHITEETMRAKQMLATMSHEIRSPLSGVVSMAEILTTTKLDKEQRQLLDVMLSSGDLVLQLINDILDLSKVESGAMKLEATKFRPREVVRHVLQTAAAPLQKMLTLEGNVADDIPIEVTGDVLRIRQILTNLVSNAVKFTHQGKVGINLYVVPEPAFAKEEESHQKVTEDQSTISANGLKEDKHTPSPRSMRCDQNLIDDRKHADHPIQNHAFSNECRSSVNSECSMNDDDTEEQTHSIETTVWIRCDVYDTGIGIPEKAIPTLFRRYMQVSADHARKYGGTGLGLAICKQLVELMGGRLTVTSKEHCGSTFTFILPYKVSTACENSDDPDDLSDVDNNEDDTTEGFFQFQPRTLGSLFTSNGSTRPHRISHKFNGFPDNDSYSNHSSNIISNGTNSIEDASSVIVDASDMSESTNSFSHSLETKHESLCNGNKQNHDNNKAHDRLQNGSANSIHWKEASREMNLETKSNEPQQTCQGQGKEDSTTSNSTSSEVTKSTLKPNILLVEDNKINIMVTKSMMKQLGYSMDVVNNGVEAIRAVQSHSYDIILMDVYMPVMNGLQTTKLIRSYEETGNWDAAREAGVEQSLSASDECSVPPKKRIHIVAMTANTMSESAEECFANGMDAFVSKPVTFLKLKECLEKYLS
ncbi:putative histidine kinase response regulator and transcription factor RR-A-type family [Medicago truncatula]|uniref:histidine kinase n=1 Tax=Medicago truncatula TaxID=3880 RepID=G7I7J7_MEDTR|nr:histidine kinase 5 [Medicago truncatula]AES59049.2 histidine kinase cytokinin receptor [Medicago truncatula]RHN77048.1 putative histidine kinase response regulator and transcription factor RR-A-type family [Medicago truncatula]